MTGPFLPTGSQVQIDFFSRAKLIVLISESMMITLIFLNGIAVSPIVSVIKMKARFSIDCHRASSVIIRKKYCVSLLLLAV